MWMGNGLVNPENRVCQRANACETDFAVRIKRAQAPGWADEACPGNVSGRIRPAAGTLASFGAGARP